MSFFSDLDKLKQGTYLTIVALASALSCGAAIGFYFFRNIFVELNPISFIVFCFIFYLPLFTLFFIPVLGFGLASFFPSGHKSHSTRVSERVPVVIVIVLDILLTDLFLLLWLTLSYLFGMNFRAFITGLLMTALPITVTMLTYAHKKNVRP